MQQIYPL